MGLEVLSNHTHRPRPDRGLVCEPGEKACMDIFIEKQAVTLRADPMYGQDSPTRALADFVHQLLEICERPAIDGYAANIQQVNTIP